MLLVSFAVSPEFLAFFNLSAPAGSQNDSIDPAIDIRFPDELDSENSVGSTRLLVEPSGRIVEFLSSDPEQLVGLIG